MSADEAYSNSAHIPDGESYYGRWKEAAAGFREASKFAEIAVPYGPSARQVYDIFHPERSAKGTVIFVHGGYWMACGPTDFSHLAAGAVAAGYACALPGYTLAPAARIADITQEVAQSVAAIARRTVGPLYLVGHSAGGHLVARMGCADVAGEWKGRVARIMPISPLSNLNPLMDTSMNETLGIDEAEAEVESPVLHDAPSAPVTVVVGGAERPAFLDQAAWLVDRWGAEHLVLEGRHHFDVIEGLEDAGSELMQALLR